MSNELERYKRLVDFLAETLGNTFDAGLFELTDSGCPMLIAGNGETNGFEQIRDYVAEAAVKCGAQAKSCLTNRPVEIGSSKLLKISVYFIRDEQQAIIGALWLSMRCDFFLRLDAFAANMLQFNLEDMDAEEKAPPAASPKPTLDRIAEMAEEFSADPGRMSLEERQEFICDLYDEGIFNLKGAVARTAEMLRVSEQSVYRYVAKIRKAREW